VIVTFPVIVTVSARPVMDINVTVHVLSEMVDVVTVLPKLMLLALLLDRVVFETAPVRRICPFDRTLLPIVDCATLDPHCKLPAMVFETMLLVAKVPDIVI
jgi:hypothetical protein